MPVITVKTTNKKIQVSQGENLMKTLLANQVPVASSCSGEGICHKCFLNIETGIENLSDPTPTEIYLVTEKEISASQRLSCQCVVLGDITVDAKYW